MGSNIICFFLFKFLNKKIKGFALYFFITINIFSLEYSGSLEAGYSYSEEVKEFLKKYFVNVKDEKWQLNVNNESGKFLISQNIHDFKFNEYYYTKFGTTDKEYGLEFFYKNFYNFLYSEKNNERIFDTKYKTKKLFLRGVYSFLKEHSESEYRSCFDYNFTDNFKINITTFYLNNLKFNFNFGTSFYFLDSYINRSESATLLGIKLKNYFENIDLNIEIENLYEIIKDKNQKKLFISKNFKKIFYVRNFEISFSYADEEESIQKAVLFLNDFNSFILLWKGNYYDISYSYINGEANLSCSLKKIENEVLFVLNGSLKKEIMKNIYIKINLIELFTLNYKAYLGSEIVF